MNIYPKTYKRSKNSPTDTIIVALSLFYVLFISLKGLILNWEPYPIFAHGDLIAVYRFLQASISGEILRDYSAGFPFGTAWLIQPLSDPLQIVALTLISKISGVYLGVKIYWSLSFILTWILSYFLFKKLNVNVGLSAVLGVAVTYLPWHIARIDHIFYGSTWPYLVIAHLVLHVFLFNQDMSKTKTLVTIAAITALFGTYLGAFSILSYFLSVIILFLLRCIKLEKIKTFIFIGLSQIGLYVLPLLIQRNYRENIPDYIADPFVRDPSESISSAGSIKRIYFPSELSNFSPIRSVASRMFPLTGQPESRSVSNFGTLILFICVLITVGYVIHWIYRRNKFDLIFLYFSFFLLSLFLWFLPYGLNYQFSLHVNPSIRAWNRLSPLIQIVTLVIFSLAIQSIYRIKKLKFTTYTSLLLIVIFFIDQAPLSISNNGQAGKSAFVEMQDYTNQIRKIRSLQCGTLQIPFMGFPEFPTAGNMHDYDLFWPALADPNFKGSYGVFKGTSSFVFKPGMEEEILQKENVSELLKYGFCGVDIDLNGYPEKPIWLKKFISKPGTIYSESKWHAYVPIVRTPILSEIPEKPMLFLTKGFSGEEADKSDFWKWSTSANSEILILNPKKEKLIFQTVLESAPCAGQRLRFSLNNRLLESVDLKTGSRTELSLVVPPASNGRLIIEIETNGRACHSNGDTRDLRYRLINYEVSRF
jgi:hypothetical protein